MLDKTITDFTGKSIERTGDPLNFAIDGDGFFVVETPEGEGFTRNGDFGLSPEGILVSAEGFPVLSDNGRVEVHEGELSVDLDGTVRTDGKELGHLLLVDFEKPYKLEKSGAGIYKSPADANRVEVEFTYVRQRYLEKANADIIREMADMIESYKNCDSDQTEIEILDAPLEEAADQVGRMR
ncbi:MAG TPA: hypothetical protein ENO22_05060 [candidate division Zixibacteria bacterium]|nr:hypothetical protein [candidate division Zixibacteria bacterium]